MSQLAKVFQLSRQLFNPRRGAILAVTLGLLIIVGVLPHERRYFLSAIFGALLVAVVDPGGEYAYRVLRLAGFAVGGALLTALGFGIGGGPWGWVVLAAFVATVLGGLAVKYGLHRFVAAYLLNVWFIIALGLGLLRLGPFHTDPWAQALAWLAGSALWIVVTFIMWLARGRETRPQPVAEIPGDISPRPLTRPIILFAVIRAVAVSAAVAIAFGLHLPNACWMPIAAIIAMKPSLQQSTFVAEQRVAGTIAGAAVAALVLLAVDSTTALEVIIVVLFALAGSIRTVSYTWYTAAVAGAVLIAMDVPTRPTLRMRDGGSCSPSPGWESPSSSCSSPTGSRSAPPKRHHRHLFPRARQGERVSEPQARCQAHGSSHGMHDDHQHRPAVQDGGRESWQAWL